MDLRELKKEVHGLPGVTKTVQQFQMHWLKPLRSNTNLHLPFLHRLPQEKKRLLNSKVSSFQETLQKVQQGQQIHDKLQTYSRYLVELKLASLQGNYAKAKLLTSRLLNDEFLNISNTIGEIKSFQENTNTLHEQYQEITDLLHKELSLEEVVFFMDLPHKIYLYNLIKIAQKQGNIARELGRNFVKIAKEAHGRK